MLVQEPGSKYVGHITPETGTARSISNSILSFVPESDWNLIKAVGSDGTAVNTGNKTCFDIFIKLMESENSLDF